MVSIKVRSQLNIDYDTSRQERQEALPDDDDILYLLITIGGEAKSQQVMYIDRLPRATILRSWGDRKNKIAYGKSSTEKSWNGVPRCNVIYERASLLGVWTYGQDSFEKSTKLTRRLSPES